MIVYGIFKNIKQHLSSYMRIQIKEGLAIEVRWFDLHGPNGINLLDKFPVFSHLKPRIFLESSSLKYFETFLLAFQKHFLYFRNFKIIYFII